MLFFPFLAVLIWYFAGKYRRTWRGVLAVFVGMAVFALLEIILIRAGAVGFAGMKPWLVVWLLIFSAVLVITVAIFIFFLPIPPPPYVHCRRCRYNLSGLDSTDLRCPECGLVWKRPAKCPHCRHSLAELPPYATRCAMCGAQVVPQGLVIALTASDPSASPAQEAPAGPDEEHHNGQAGDEHPPDEPHLPLPERGNQRD